MNYRKLKQKIISSYGQITLFFEKEGESIEFTEGGFYQSVRNDSLKVCKLENISKKLGVSMAFWWDEETSIISDDRSEYLPGNSKYVDELQKNMEWFRAECDRKNKVIEELNMEISELRAKRKASA